MTMAEFPPTACALCPPCLLDQSCDVCVSTLSLLIIAAHPARAQTPDTLIDTVYILCSLTLRYSDNINFCYHIHTFIPCIVRITYHRPKQVPSVVQGRMAECFSTKLPSVSILPGIHLLKCSPVTDRAEECGGDQVPRAPATSLLQCAEQSFYKSGALNISPHQHPRSRSRGFLLLIKIV